MGRASVRSAPWPTPPLRPRLPCCRSGRGPRRSPPSSSSGPRPASVRWCSTATTSGGPSTAGGGRPDAAGLPPVGRHDARGAAARVERPHGRPRVRRWRVVGPVGDGVVRELGGPTPLPRRARRRAGRGDPRAGCAAGDRWADGDVSPDGRWMLCVREHHPIGGGPADVVNEVVRFDLDPRRVRPVRLGRRLGRPSSSTGRTSCPIPAGARRRGDLLAGVGPPGHAVGRHPAHGRGARRQRAVLVAGGADESVFQPRWHDDGSLWFISDRSGWWNLYRWTAAAGSSRWS